jgi:hypothetical protein
MNGLPKDIDLTFFVGKTLNSVRFAVNVIDFSFDEKISITLESSYQHQQSFEAEHDLVGTIQSVYLIPTSSLMQLAGHTVISATGTEDGTLTLTFDHGQVLHLLDSSKAYESYQFTDGEHFWVV